MKSIAFIPTYDYFSHKLFVDMARQWTDVACHYLVIRDTSIHTSWDYPPGDYPSASLYTASTVYGGVVDTEALFLELDRYLATVRPDILVSPSDALDVHIIAAAAAKKYGIKLLTVQPAFLNLHEGFPGERPKIYGAESCDVLAVWSDFWADICRRNGSKAEMRVVGCYDFDRMHAVMERRDELAAKLRERAGMGPDAPVVSIFLPHDEETGLRFTQLIQKSVRANPSTVFAVKPHPRHKSWDMAGLLRHPNAKLSLPGESDEEVLAASDATISVMSYTSLKAMMVGLPALILRDPPIDHPFFDASPAVMLGWGDDFDQALARALAPGFREMGRKRLQRYLTAMIGHTEPGYLERLKAVAEEFTGGLAS